MFSPVIWFLFIAICSLVLSFGLVGILAAFFKLLAAVFLVMVALEVVNRS